MSFSISYSFSTAVSSISVLIFPLQYSFLLVLVTRLTLYSGIELIGMWGPGPPDMEQSSPAPPLNDVYRSAAIKLITLIFITMT